MRRKKRSWRMLLVGIVSLCTLVYMLVFVSPQTDVSLQNWHIPMILLFFPLLFITIFSLIEYIFKSAVHGLLAGLLICTYLLFRLNHLTHPFFLVILLALFLTLELLFARPKQ